MSGTHPVGQSLTGRPEKYPEKLHGSVSLTVRVAEATAAVARTTHGWTLEELAAKAVVSRSTPAAPESGKHQENLGLLLPLTRQLGIGLNDLIRTETTNPGYSESLCVAAGWRWSR